MTIDPTNNRKIKKRKIGKSRFSQWAVRYALLNGVSPTTVKSCVRSSFQHDKTCVSVKTNGQRQRHLSGQVAHVMSEVDVEPVVPVESASMPASHSRSLSIVRHQRCFAGPRHTLYNFTLRKSPAKTGASYFEYNTYMNHDSKRIRRFHDPQIDNADSSDSENMNANKVPTVKTQVHDECENDMGSTITGWHDDVLNGEQDKENITNMEI